MCSTCQTEYAILLRLEQQLAALERTRQDTGATADPVQLKVALDAVADQCRAKESPIGDARAPDRSLAGAMSHVRVLLDACDTGLDPLVRGHFEFRWRELFLVRREMLSLFELPHTNSLVLVAALGRRFQGAHERARELARDVQRTILSEWDGM